MRSLIFLILSYMLISSPKVYAQYQNLELNINGKYYIIRYLVHQHSEKARQVLRRDFVTFHLETRTEKDSVLKTTYPDSPIIKEISIEDYKLMDKGFLQDLLLQLFVGDSATFLINSNYLYEAIKRTRPKFIKADSELKYIIKVLKVQNEGEVKVAKGDVIFKQRKADEKLIAPYVAKNLPKAKRTYSGIWYHIQQEDTTGEKVVENDVVSIKYTGKFLDGRVFNSSDRDGRMFEFPVTGGVAIKGFDELLLLMRVGSKGTFIIPSYLAYGAEGFGDLVPPNTVLVFEIEVMDIISRKIIIENKGQILSEEKGKDKEKQKKTKDPKKEEEERLKEMEKDVKKKMKNIHIKGDN